MGDEKRGLGLAFVNEIAQVSIIFFDVGLAGPHWQALRKELAEIECNLATLLKPVGRLGILWNKHANHADASSRPYGFHQIVHGQVRLLVAFRIMCLLADTFTTLVCAFAVGEFQNLLNGGSF